MKKDRLKGNLILILTAIVWGSGFVAQSSGRELIGTNTFNGIRMLLGSLVLVPVFLITTKCKKSTKPERKKLIFAGIISGIILFAASSLQTWGIAYTTSGKSGFITAMYMIFVPIIGIFIGKKITARTIFCAVLALFGMYLLCMSDFNGSFNIGDIITLICAFVFALHILFIDKYAMDIDPIKFSSLQFFVCGIINIILMFIFEEPTFESVFAAKSSILFSGLCACGIGYTLQPIGQRYAEPTVASILMSLESVFALIFGIIILHETPYLSEIIGCVIMFAAIILIQLPNGFFKKSLNKNERKQSI